MQGIEPTLHLLRSLAPRTRGALLRPARFFLAGSGVITLAFEGFTSGLLDLKEAVRPGLLPEYPGSLWPKITLGALAYGKPLAPEEIRLIWEATGYADSRLAADGGYVQVRELVVVEALTRSLELRGRSVRFQLHGDLEETVPAEHARFVRGVLGQWKRDLSPEYVAAIRRHGHGRDHYQRPCRAFTLVAYMGDQLPAIDDLRSRVARTLPGRYHWFDRSALHMTLRTLEPDPSLLEVEPVQFFAKDHL